MGRPFGERKRGGLTDRQRDYVLAILKLSERGLPPTTRELANELGIKSTHAVFQALASLEKKMATRRVPMISRGIFVTEEGLRMLGDP